MVSTRLMSMGNGTVNELASHSSSTDGPAKFTRNSAAAACYKPAARTVESIQFLELPQEVIEKVFSYLSFREISKLRLVSRRIDQICGYILNSTFSKLQNQMLQRFQDIKSKMPRRESARRSHYLACESDIIETLHMRLTLLQMTFGKHIERKYCCFFPGEILDEVYSILLYIKTTQKLDLPYKVTDELFDLSTMAMEYFKEKIEPNLPEIAYFSTDFLHFSANFAGTSPNKYMPLESSTSESVNEVDQNDTDVLENEDLVEIPQSNMVLRKRIRKIKQGMKRYNNQLTVLRQELKTCKKKTSEQQKQISDQQKQLADQQKQTLEYATRLDEYDKKNEEISRKFSTLLQELNKCKTELQYWRCKSPAIPPICSTCGSPQPEELQAFINQGVNPEGIEIIADLAGLPMLEQNTKSIEESADVTEPIEAAQKDNRCETSSGSSVAAVRSIKRKISEEDPIEPKAVSKKTRRGSKARCKKSKI
ncbi:F-box only protein 28 [Cylas formicarius]|uniref:F-box only protein 28 n=1 Tax=Cylas formicarius TaxID=197179 RepID=UPI0029584EBD|nr:F-box only protein 28 [Cylas formicarius]XP_060524896.1 F-box only protein 28 [Cylas formicarius]XP_060524897.1 F-box only protein 28 [Cylas formicarius]